MRSSVFAKLVAIMLAMAVSILALVGVFFLAYVGPSLNRTVSSVVHSYARVIAASAPDYETAKRLTDGLEIWISYEGPTGSWSTSRYMPSIAQVRNRHWRGFVIEPSPKGGEYLFTQSFLRPMHEAHLLVLWLLLVLLVSVVFVTYAVLRRLLRPVRDLGEGVALLSSGNLDVVVPQTRRDEFGALAVAFNQMVARVRDMIRARDQLLLDVSHELRSPVTRMKVALELLPDDDKKRGMAADLDEMELMIRELLELERLREGRLRKSRQNIVPIVDSVVERYPGVRVMASSTDVTLDVDAEKLRTVIRNLVENAIKYSLPDSRPVEVTILDKNGSVVIRVTDDGPGIPEEDLASIFEPFFRVDRSRSRKTGGYGLGLSISKRIVEAHGGTITATNNPARGTTFTASLPK